MPAAKKIAARLITASRLVTERAGRCQSLHVVLLKLGEGRGPPIPLRRFHAEKYIVNNE